MIQPIREKLQGTLDKTYLNWKSWRSLNKGRFQQKIPLRINASKYSVSTIQSIHELQEVLRLRYEVFIREGLNKKRPVKLDLDRFDFLADHLVVRNFETGKILGTYRMISSMFSEEFYSEEEFNLDNLLERGGHKLEMGRACIHREHRNGAVIALLWRGVKTYLDITNTRYLFGCGSIKTMRLDHICSIYQYLVEEDYHSDEFDIYPTPEFRIKGLESCDNFLGSLDKKEVRKKVPPLLRSYFKAGARAVGEPALDRAFQCIDFLTVLDTSKLDSHFDRRFSGL